MSVHTPVAKPAVPLLLSVSVPPPFLERVRFAAPLNTPEKVESTLPRRLPRVSALAAEELVTVPVPDREDISTAPALKSKVAVLLSVSPLTVAIELATPLISVPVPLTVVVPV